MRSFKARSVISSEKGSVRKVAPKEPTKPLDISLASVCRSEKRKEFNLKMEEKERRLESERQEREAAREREEAEEVKRIRAESNFKATPIQHFRQTEVKVEKKELTNPVAPNFATQVRADHKKLL